MKTRLFTKVYPMHDSYSADMMRRDSRRALRAYRWRIFLKTIKRAFWPSVSLVVVEVTSNVALGPFYEPTEHVKSHITYYDGER